MNVVLHPAAAMKKLEAEADAWAARTNLAGFVARLTRDERSRQKLVDFAKQCFIEGLYEGASRRG